MNTIYNICTGIHYNVYAIYILYCNSCSTILVCVWVPVPPTPSIPVQRLPLINHYITYYILHSRHYRCVISCIEVPTFICICVCVCVKVRIGIMISPMYV